jgi:hypothetical protein
MPQFPLYANGRQYMTNCYNSNPTHGSPIATLWRMENGVTRPVAALGRANDWSILKTDAFKPNWPEGVDLKGDVWRNQAMFVWSDTNHNVKVDPEEVDFWKAGCGGITVMPDLAFVAARVEYNVMRYAPVRFTPDGVPVYEPGKGEVLLEGAQSPMSSGGDQALVAEDGSVVVTVGPKPFARDSLAGGRAGRATWSYPSLWPGLHASHDAPTADRPGMLLGTTRLLGGFVTPKEGEAGPLWAINGNMGNLYLFTADGLFVSECFRDVREGKSWTMPAAERGMRLDDLSLHDENFWPTMTQTDDGGIYLVDGARTSLVRIEGLEAVRRIPAARVEVTPQGLKEAAAWHEQAEAERQRERGSGTMTVRIKAAAPVVDGVLDEWTRAAWVTIDKRGARGYFQSQSKPYNVTAAICVSDDRLYAAFRTGDASLLKNAGDPIAPFKTGGALDLMLGTQGGADPDRPQPVAGDQRLLVTKVEDRTLAILYRAVDPDATAPVPFSSPWRTITLDSVQDISDQVRLAGNEGDFELSVPLETLGLHPEPGSVIQGDVGVLRGNGFQTLQRVYWNNKATAITSDVPSEAALTPRLWGRLEFQPEQP